MAKAAPKKKVKETENVRLRKELEELKEEIREMKGQDSGSIGSSGATSKDFVQLQEDDPEIL